VRRQRQRRLELGRVLVAEVGQHDHQRALGSRPIRSTARGAVVGLQRLRLDVVQRRDHRVERAEALARRDRRAPRRGRRRR
jgi:hypothetical protein